MKKTSGRKAINEILNMLEEEEHIDEDFKHFINQCLEDYLWRKELRYSLISIFKFRKDWLSKETIKKLKEELKNF